MRAVLHRAFLHAIIGITCLWLPCNAVCQGIDPGVASEIDAIGKSPAASFSEGGGTMLPDPERKELVLKSHADLAACQVSRPAPKIIPSMAANPEILAFIGLCGATVLLLRKKH